MDRRCFSLKFFKIVLDKAKPKNYTIEKHKGESNSKEGIMAELKFTIDTDDLYGEDGYNFEELLTDSLQKEVIKNCQSNITSDKFKEFARLTSDTIVAGIKLRMETFLSEDIVLADRWGKPEFIGSIEDLIKSRFDGIILRPVDSDGKTLQGCTSSGMTWIEWRIKDSLNDSLKSHIKTATRSLERTLKKLVDDKLTAIKDEGLKKQVDDAFISILKKTT